MSTPAAAATPGPGEGRRQAWFGLVWMLVPGLLVTYLGFNAGGLYPGSTGAAAAVLAILVACRLLTDRRRLSRPTVRGSIAVVGLVALGALSLISQIWSDTPPGAVLAFDLLVLYAALTALHSGRPLTPQRLRVMFYGLTGGLTAVCGAGLVSRILPHVLPVGPNFQTTRLSYPLAYWNAEGMLVVAGIALCAHISSDADTHPAARVLAAALIPAFATTLLLTFSRGAIAVLVIVLLLYLVLTPRLTLLGTAAAVAPFSAIVLRTAYDASLLGSSDPAGPAAVAQGRHVAITLAWCVAASAVSRALLLVGERRLPGREVSRRVRLAPSLILVLIVAGVGLAKAGSISRHYNDFVNSTISSGGAPARSRLTSVSNDGRIVLWRLAWKGFKSEPLRGHGAGTYVLLWDRYRTWRAYVNGTHNLYLQTLDELGVVGAVALAMFWLGLLFGLVGPLRLLQTRPAAALALALLVGWALHSAVDWDWQTPAVLVPAIAVAAAVGANASASRIRGRWRGVRPAAALLALCAAILPALMAASQAELNSATAAFARDDCATAAARSRAAHALLGLRPEPLEVLAYCQAQTGQSRLAIATIGQAIDRDPHNWRYHYAEGVVTAAAGRDPMPALRTALALNPLESMIGEAMYAFHGQPRPRWRHIALGLRLDVS